MKCTHPIIFTALLSLLSASGLYAVNAPSTQLLQIGKAKLTVEIANTHSSRMRGLMFRKRLADNQGMLFVSTHLNRDGFWMKNTFIPLSIGFFNEQATLQQVMQMTASKPNQKHYPVYRPKRQYLYALEVNKGWFSKNKIKVGDKFTVAKRRGQ